MATFLLIRHAQCDPVGHSIAGRAPGVHLNAQGRSEAERLGQRLASLSVSAVYSSPLERARETAACIAQHHGMEVEIAPGLTEIDFGNWTGRTLADLAQLNEWKAFNSFRSGTRPPGGESAAEVLARALSELERLIKVHPTSEDVVALVSHGDVLRALVAHFLGMPMDLYHRLELSPASVSVLRLEVYGPQLLLLNTTGHLPAQLASRRTRS